MIGKAGPTRWIGVAACALLLAGAAGCSGGSAFSRYCDDTGCYACEGDGNCYPDNLPPCTTDAACEADSVCTTMGCARRCTDDSECRDGEYCCDYGYCAPKDGDLPAPIPTSSACTADSCADDERCDETGHCVPRCASDADCADGQACSTATGECLDKGEEPTDTIYCKTTSECPEGLICIGGCCHIAPEAQSYCQDSSVCGDGRTCLNEECHAICEDSSTCPTGQVCADGACIDDPAPANPACVFDVDCAGGQTCINAYCHDLCEDGDACGTGESCQAGVCRADYRASSR